MDNLRTNLAHLMWLKSIGIDYYCSEVRPTKSASLLKKVKTDETNQQIIAQKMKIKNTLSSPAQKPPENDGDAVALARYLANQAQSLEELYEHIRNFDRCELKNFAKNTVLCDGDIGAKIMLIGEAPGATEDEQGRSFCGESGQLLDKMLGLIGISRTKNAYITNTVFWRPPGNRRPTSEEIEMCRPFVEKHIALKKPKLIILVGGTATTSFLTKNDTISNLRSNLYSYQNQYLAEPVKTTAIFHPAYLLRQPLKKKDMWFDLLKIKDILTKLEL